jgi:hypothetical protein
MTETATLLLSPTREASNRFLESMATAAKHYPYATPEELATITKAAIKDKRRFIIASQWHFKLLKKVRE